MLNENRFRAIYTEFLESGLTIRDFCSNNHFNEQKFYYWQRRMKSLLPSRRGFIPLVFDTVPSRAVSEFPAAAQPSAQSSSSALQPGVGAGCVINYPNGVSLSIGGGVDVDLIRSLLFVSGQ